MCYVGTPVYHTQPRLQCILLYSTTVYHNQPQCCLPHSTTSKLHSITFTVHYIQPYCILTQSTTLLSTTLLCNAFYHILPIQTHHFQPHQHHIQPHCSALLQVIPIVKSNSTNLQKCHIATKQQCIFCNDMAYFAGFAAICYPCWPSTAITARI